MSPEVEEKEASEAGDEEVLEERRAALVAGRSGEEGQERVSGEDGHFTSSASPLGTASITMS